MNYSEFIQETYNSLLVTENPFPGGNPLESTDITNNSGSFSSPILDVPTEMTPTEGESLTEIGDLINSDIFTSTTDLLTETKTDLLTETIKDSLTGVTNTQESLQSVIKDLSTEDFVDSSSNLFNNFNSTLDEKDGGGEGSEGSEGSVPFPIAPGVPITPEQFVNSELLYQSLEANSRIINNLSPTDPKVKPTPEVQAEIDEANGRIDTLLKFTEEVLALEAVPAFINGLFAIRNPAPSAAQALGTYLGEFGKEPKGIPTLDSYQNSVRDAFSQANIQPPPFVINSIFNHDENTVTNDLKIASPAYPDIPIYPHDNHFGHLHFDKNSNLVRDIQDSNEFKSAVDFTSSQIQSAVDRGFFQVSAGTIDISQDGEYTFKPEQAPVIDAGGLLYGTTGGLFDALNDLEFDTDALLTVGDVKSPRFVGVINELNINSSSGGERTFTADVDYYGWDAYSWGISDFRNRLQPLYAGAGINPATFGQVWALQQYGYGRPITTSFRIEEALKSPVV